ncbi:hypothetical protein FB645_003325 [Coemansia sp. IMI 203386]|nr:hypothetical protein FB645_003325 [Coemansia sp. IMI 203386]
MTAHSVSDDIDAVSVSTATTTNEEQEPLLSSQQLTDIPEAPLRSNAVPTVAKRLTTLLGLCLAGVCMLLGMYILYIILHIPKIMLAVRGNEPELEAASLIDIADESLLFSARLQFPPQRLWAMRIPFANVTVFHENNAVGWLSVRDFELKNTDTAVELFEVFHIVDQQAMERLVGETVAQRRIAVDTLVAVDMSGFGSLLPTVTVRRKVDFLLPPPPQSVNYTINEISGPSVDEKNDGVTARAAVKASLPMLKGISANIDPLCFDISFSNTTIATVLAGPVTVDSAGNADICSAITVKRIASDKHESALADLARGIAGSKEINIAVSGTAADRCSSTAPLWLRRALSKTIVPISINMPHLPTGDFPALDGLVKELVVDRFYANWNASSGFNPWIAVSGQTTVQLPNPYGANFTFEIESLIPHVQLVDDKKRVFATVDVPTIPLQMLQISPLTYSLRYDFEHVGLNVAEKRQKQFTHTMQRALVDRHLFVGINGTLDAVLSTSIGKLRIGGLPFYSTIDHMFFPDDKPSLEHAAEDGLAVHSKGHSDDIVLASPGGPKLSVPRIHIIDTSEDLIAMQIEIDLDNPYSYGAYLSELAMHVGFAGLRVAKIGIKELAIRQGANKIIVYVDFYNHPKDPRQKMMFLQASSGKPMTVEISGFPNCTTIAPLEASLRDFSQRVTVDTSKLKDGHGGLALGQLPKVLREVVFHVFSLSAEATVANPVSGAGIWLQAIEAIGYHQGDIPLGTLSYNFMDGSSRRTPASSNGFLLPYNQSVTTPRLPITANETSIGWDVVRRAIGGTLDVDVFTNIQVLVGKAQFNITAMGKNAPVKIRF